MSKRVTRIFVENCVLIVNYSDCTTETYDISNCGDKTPEEKKPGDWPPPDPVSDVVCRVAIKVGQAAAERLNNYLSGLILTNAGANLPALYSSVKIAEYGWSISLYDPLYSFYWDSVFEGGGTPGDAAKTDWDANSAAIIAAVQEALYCTLPASGDINDMVREVWAVALDGMGTEFMSLLSDLLMIWPLAQLREMAFNASVTVDAVDCESFDCEGSGLPSGCATEVLDWSEIGATPAGWESAGVMNFAGWTGDLEGIDNGDTDYSCTRSPNDDWRNNDMATSGNPGKIGIKYTLAAPCVVTRIRFTYTVGNGNTKRMYIGVKTTGGVYTILLREQFDVISSFTNSIDWINQTPVEVEEIYFFALHGGTSGAPNRILSVGINE